MGPVMAPVMVDLTDTHNYQAEHNESAKQDIQTKHDAQLAEQLQEYMTRRVMI